MQALAQNPQLADTLLNKYGLALFAAILSGLAAYITGTRLEAKKSNKTLKQLSWDMDVNTQLVEINDELKDKVQVHYKDKPVKKLTTVAFRITNTGGAPVLKQFVRFHFPDRADMLSVTLDPRPEPELDVSEVTKDVPPGNRRFRIGHLEPGQSVGFRFVSDGGDWSGWDRIHLTSEEGGVALEPRSVSRVKADKEHVRPFVLQAVLLVLTQLVLNGIGFYDEVVQVVRIAITLLLGGLLLSHLMPVVRLLEGAVFRATAEARNLESQNLVRGDVGGTVLQVRTVNGDIKLVQPDDDVPAASGQ